MDWIQNDSARSTVAPYSLRALAWPTPLGWEEVEAATEHLLFGPEDVRERIERLGDLFEPVLTVDQRLPEGNVS